MVHKTYKIIDYKVVERYTIWVKFDDESNQVINFAPVLYGAMWGPLRDVALFNQVAIDPIARTLSWPNGADFDPETLYNWPEYVEALATRAQAWERVFA